MALRLVTSEDTTAALLERARRRDEAALGELWSRYAVMVRRLLQRTLGPDDATEDLTQDVFVRFVEGLGRVRDETSLQSWLVSVTLNSARSALRRRRRWRWALTRLGRHDDVSPQRPDTSLAMHRLFNLLDQLDEEERLAFVLRHLEEFELADVARHLDCSLATVKRRLVSARGRLERLASNDLHIREFLRQGGSHD